MLNLKTASFGHVIFHAWFAPDTFELGRVIAPAAQNIGDVS
jgi:hypothetical protein